MILDGKKLRDELLVQYKEKIKEEKYNSNNIFKKDKKECFEYTNENLPIIASKENFIKRILKNIKKYFNSKA